MHRGAKRKELAFGLQSSRSLKQFLTSLEIVRMEKVFLTKVVQGFSVRDLDQSIKEYIASTEWAEKPTLTPMPTHNNNLLVIISGYGYEKQ